MEKICNGSETFHIKVHQGLEAEHRQIQVMDKEDTINSEVNYSSGKFNHEFLIPEAFRSRLDNSLTWGETFAWPMNWAGCRISRRGTVARKGLLIMVIPMTKDVWASVQFYLVELVGKIKASMWTTLKPMSQMVPSSSEANTLGSSVTSA